MNIRTSYTHTRYACYLGYVTQAIVNNFVPLLLVTFNRTWNIEIEKLAALVSVNFGIQLVVDLLGAALVRKIGYRTCIVSAHLFASAGMILLAILPYVIPYPFIGIIMAISVYAIGGGLTEVLISPIVEACPSENKEGQMSLLHSFYCWGHMFVIIVTTLFFLLFGTENWRIMSCIWAVIPLCNAVYFMLVPIRTLEEEGTEPHWSWKQLLSTPLFWLLVIMMICSGASEQAMSQWASAFAEAGLGVSKTVGDLAGPLMFAFLMGVSRLLSFGITRKISTDKLMFICCGLCCVSYLTASLSPFPILSLIGCGLCGLSVGFMWPGTFNTAAIGCKGGGTIMFALLALAGDFGCSAGPWFVGFITELSNTGSLKSGLLPAVMFPILLAVSLCIFRFRKKNKIKEG